MNQDIIFYLLKKSKYSLEKYCLFMVVALLMEYTSGLFVVMSPWFMYGYLPFLSLLWLKVS